MGLLSLVSARRQFNLPRWVRGSRFTAMHNQVVAWLDEHFTVIERAAPWLRRMGADVHDCCSGVVTSVFEFSLESGPRARVSCSRKIIVVYGFDGYLGERVGRLNDALSVAGWERSSPFSRLREREDTNRHAWLHWEPSPAVSLRPEPDRPPPSMLLTWTSRGQASSLRQDPNRRNINTRNHLTVESSDTEYWKLPEAALAQYEHTATLMVSLGYCASAGRNVPKYLRPSRRRALPPHGA